MSVWGVFYRRSTTVRGGIVMPADEHSVVPEKNPGASSSLSIKYFGESPGRNLLTEF